MWKIRLVRNLPRIVLVASFAVIFTVTICGGPGWGCGTEGDYCKT